MSYIFRCEDRAVNLQLYVISVFTYNEAKCTIFAVDKDETVGGAGSLINSTSIPAQQRIPRNLQGRAKLHTLNDIDCRKFVDAICASQGNIKEGKGYLDVLTDLLTRSADGEKPVALSRASMYKAISAITALQQCKASKTTNPDGIVSSVLLQIWNKHKLDSEDYRKYSSHKEYAMLKQLLCKTNSSVKTKEDAEVLAQKLMLKEYLEMEKGHKQENNN